jgi:hypothetical protein
VHYSREINLFLALAAVPIDADRPLNLHPNCFIKYYKTNFLYIVYVYKYYTLLRIILYAMHFDINERH